MGDGWPDTLDILRPSPLQSWTVRTHTETGIFMRVLGPTLKSSWLTVGIFLIEPSPQPKLGTFQLQLLCLTWLS